MVDDDVADYAETLRLRNMLGERGVEWEAGLRGTTFVGDWCFVEYPNGKLAATCEPTLTPEQAIEATLGADDGSRWHELFGTPERAAKTICGACQTCSSIDCIGCPIRPIVGIRPEVYSVLEWLRGKAVS